MLKGLIPVAFNYTAMKQGRKGLLYCAYPVEGRDRPDPEADWHKCPGCLGRVDKTDPRHTRAPGECAWPLVESSQWDCPGCKVRAP
eukprot:3757263-Lingulodinium_polyedra.AAC.1